MPTNRYALIAPTGEIIQIGRTDTECLDTVADTEAGEFLILEPGDVSDDTHFWDFMTGNWRAFPDKPGPWAAFDFSSRQWIDPRTAADHQAALLAAREAARLDKSELLTRLFMAGLLPEADLLVAAKGDIPPTIEAMLDALPLAVFPAEARTIARFKWAADQVISRMNPVIVLAGQALGVDDAAMDQIFGVVTPS